MNSKIAKKKQGNAGNVALQRPQKGRLFILGELKQEGRAPRVGPHLEHARQVMQTSCCSVLGCEHLGKGLGVLDLQLQIHFSEQVSLQTQEY